MKQTFSTIFLLAFMMTALCIFPSQSRSDPSIAIKNAVIRDICRDVFWQNSRYALGESLPIHIKLDGEKFFAWVAHLGRFQNETLSYYYEGRTRNEVGVVTSIRALNERLNIPPPDPWNSVHGPNFKGDPIVSMLPLPAACPRSLDPSTPEKQKMVDTVFSTIQHNLNDDQRFGVTSYPSNVTVVVADFNIDYPLTYVLVEGEKVLNLIVVYLHNADDWENAEYQRGPYPIAERRIGTEHKELLKRIREHGITRSVNIKGKS